jgi:hypothetical protein
LNKAKKIAAVGVLLALFCYGTLAAQRLFVTTHNDNIGNNEYSFSSLDKALEKVLALRKKGNNSALTIYIAAGDYHLASPVTITPEYGSLKIIGKGAEHTVLKGSTLLKLSWQKYDNNIWVAEVQKNIRFDQLFINGKPQLLARYPDYSESGGHWQGHAANAISPERVKTWKNPVGIIVHAMHMGEWGDFHFVSGGVANNGELVLTGGHQNNRPSAMHKEYRMVENVLEELDSPGEWFLDKNNTLFYWPPKDVILNQSIVEAVQQKQLVKIIGTASNPVKNVSFEGIRFEHAQRTFMENYEPLLRSDWTIYRGSAFFIEGAENTTVKNCEFTNLGGNALFVSGYNRHVKIVDNHIHECGANAICFVGKPDAVRSPAFQYHQFVPLNKMDSVRGPQKKTYPDYCTADNNLIYRIGRVEKQTAGIQIAMAMHITVSSNSIYDVPRAGINIGDGTWGGHLIEKNDVFNTVLESGDHGAFNSWGRDRYWHPDRNTMDSMVAVNPAMPGWDAIYTTVIRNNRFRCDHGWDIDLDDGSSNYHIYNNVCLNGGLKLREGFYRKVENNIIINNGFHPHVWFKNSGDVFKKNIVFTEHKDIGISEWGREVDYNLLPDQQTLLATKQKGADRHSISGEAKFADAANGNYNLQKGSAAFDLGFKPFNTTSFGVNRGNLKAMAKTPEIPKFLFSSALSKTETVDWLGATIKTISTIEERSASGLIKTAGVIIVSCDAASVLTKSGIQNGDVILAGGSQEINSVTDLLKYHQSNNWTGKLELEIFRNQKPMHITIITK